MASVNDVEIIKTALRNPSSCDSASLELLATLLDVAVPQPAATGNKVKNVPGKPSTASRTRAPARKNTGTVAKNEQALKPAERLRLATEVVNIGLKSLSQEIQSRPQNAGTTSPRQPTGAVLTVRSINVPASPTKPVKKSSSVDGKQGITSLAECTRMALAFLRKQNEKAKSPALPALQVESAMSALISKLITLEMIDLAGREIRLLATRLGMGNTKDSETTSGARSVSKSCSTQPCLSSLLHLETPPDSPQKLSLVITTQLQVVRLLRSTKTLPDPDLLFQYLCLDSTTSPANLIEIAIASNGKDKSSGQLGTLAHAIAALSDRIASRMVENPCAQKDQPASILNLRIVSLQVLWKSWSMANHNIEIRQQLCQPLKRYIESYLSDTRAATDSRLTKVNNAVDAITSLVSCTTLSDYQRNEFQSASLDFDLILQTLSRNAGDSGVIKRIADESSAKLASTSVSGARRATILCLGATTAFQESSAISNEDLCHSLETAVAAYCGSIDGSSDELDELLLTIASLRKVLMKGLNKYSDMSTSERPCWETQAIQCVLKASAFTLRYIGKPVAASKSGNTIRRQDERRTLAAKIGRATIEGVVILAKRSAQSTSEAWSHYDQALRDCLALAEQLYAKLQDSDERKSNQTPIPILISNVYWLRYLALRQSSNKQSELVTLLERSTGVLENLSIPDQKTGLLPQKLERLAYTYEQSKHWVKASAAYRYALDQCIHSGLAQTAAERLRWVPIVTSILEDNELKVIAKVIEGYCRTQSHSDKSESCMSKVNAMDGLLHGFILELQLSCFFKLHPKGPRTFAITNSIQDLGRELLDVYTENEFPIRRLRALSSLAECNVFLDQVSEAPNQLEELSSAERGMLPFHEHLIARKQAIVAMNQMQQPKLLTSALDKWLQLVSHKSISSWQALVSRIGDVKGWHDLLETIAGFSEAFGLIEQRICALDLLTHTMKLSASFDSKAFVYQTSCLASELIYLGFPNQARGLLSKGQKSLTGVASQVSQSTRWRVAQVQQFLAAGDWDRAGDIIQGINETLKVNSHHSPTDQLDETQLGPQVLFLSAKQLFMSGRLSSSMFHIKQSVKQYLQIWASLERKHGMGDKTVDRALSEDSENICQASSDDRSASFSSPKPTSNSIEATFFWPIIRPLFEALMYASEIHLHCGLVTEARYYVLEALKISEVTNAKPYMIRALSFQANLEAKADNLDKGKEIIARADKLLKSKKQASSTQSTLLRALCVINSPRSDEDRLENIDETYKMLQNIEPPQLLVTRSLETETEQLVDQLHSLSITRTTKKTMKQAIIKGKTTRSEPRTASKILTSPATEAKHGLIEQLKGQLLKLKADALAMNGGDEQALAEAEIISKALLNNNKSLVNALTCGKVHLKRGLASLQLDPLLNIIPEAILAQPAILRLDLTKPSTKQSNTVMARRKHGVPDNLGSHFKEAIACCDPSILTDLTYMTTADAHSLSELSVKTFLTFTATTNSAQSSDMVTTLLGDRLEHGRNVASIGAQAAIEADRMIYAAPKMEEVSSFDQHPLVLNPDQFQRDFVDIIPSDWHVVSMSMSDDCNELKLGTFKSETTPFVLSIPLSRESKDGSENAFTYHKGKKELARIIDLANYSTHEAVDYKKQGAKAEWWEARAALDSRLRDLLTNVENIWLSGFKSMLRHCVIDDRLLNQFETSWIAILGKHLPSRQSKKSVKANHASFDRRVLELFLRLGNPHDTKDIDESILDLLYFVVDVLWFNGEQNTCDEIDFDPMILDIKDALKSYHEGIKQSSMGSHSGHTILILDKRLHAFPWESLPCMNGQSVSRLPSLFALRRRILQMCAQPDYEETLQYSVDKSDGSFILNPSGDLKHTQSTFEKPLTSLSTWSSTINTVPKEEEIARALSTKSLYLYFGHGSGGQYIRTRAIRRLDRCAVALLMGCSSGTLTEAGEYESHGTPLTYLNAGAPAVVGTLWDVTDKDIDRFSTRMLERWGLFESEMSDSSSNETNVSPRKRTVKGKGKQTHFDVEVPKPKEKSSVGLDTAMAEARESCIMRYLNGAAPVMYGIPVVLK